MFLRLLSSVKFSHFQVWDYGIKKGCRTGSNSVNLTPSESHSKVPVFNANKWYYKKNGNEALLGTGQGCLPHLLSPITTPSTYMVFVVTSGVICEPSLGHRMLTRCCGRTKALRPPGYFLDYEGGSSVPWVGGLLRSQA